MSHPKPYKYGTWTIKHVKMVLTKNRTPFYLENRGKYNYLPFASDQSLNCSFYSVQLLKQLMLVLYGLT